MRQSFVERLKDYAQTPEEFARELAFDWYAPGELRRAHLSRADVTNVAVYALRASAGVSHQKVADLLGVSSTRAQQRAKAGVVVLARRWPRFILWLERLS